MNKGLESFKRFRNNLQWLEENTNFKGYLSNEELHIKEDLDIIETALKALEIIKSKGVAVGMLQLEEVGLKEYNDYIGDKKLYLTEEEFNLLKEVLL